MPRTNNDAWDLATSVGATATMVAAARAVATRADNPLIDDPFAEPLVRAVGIDFFTRWAAGNIKATDVDDPDGTWGLQRLADLLAARTRYFDAFFRDATSAGIRQAVILASGLDARAYRLTWPSDTTVFEIDQPQVIEFKMTTLADLDATATADLAWFPSTSDVTGRPRCAKRALTPTNPVPGSPRACWHSCRPTLRIACWTTSPRSARRGVGR
ncbi:Putative S-adenosyl-L-methionine-dependent methyltransferase [Mycobacterium canetti]|nr:Putative S-adenosyl-L-methionine-dependent methyltransferase [Mycobacterium canetti]